MIEKRFEYNYVEGAKGDYIYDVEDNRMLWELDCICELLNNPHEENQQLKEYLKKIVKTINKEKDYCLKYFQEQISKKYKTCKEYTTYNDKELQRKWSN